MAEWIAGPSCASLQLHRTHYKTKRLLTEYTCYSLHHRRISIMSRPNLFSEHKAGQLGVFWTAFKRTLYNRQSPVHCCHFATLLNINSAASPEWALAMDQVLLMVSVAFAYMAGVIPMKGSYNARRNIKYEGVRPGSSSSGSVVKNGNMSNSKYIWDEVEEKLRDALNVIALNVALDKSDVELENCGRNHPLSLSAIDESPRLRLLWATLEQLKNKVHGIAGVYETDDIDAWLSVTSEIIRNSIQPIYLTWLEGELSRETLEHDKALVERLFARVEGDESIVGNIRNSGKEDLYAELLFLLRFGDLRARSGCKYDSKLLRQHGVDILEDLVVSLADGIASMYLKIISIDSNMCAEMNNMGLVVCSLSTRALQRLRNEVSFKRWLYQNIESVVSMYEDRFDLFSLQTKPVVNSDSMPMKNFTWWKKLTCQQAAVTSLRYVLITQFPLPVKRTMELRALSGWRYYFSLFLEFADIAMPMVRAVSSKGSGKLWDGNESQFFLGSYYCSVRKFLCGFESNMYELLLFLAKRRSRDKVWDQYLILIQPQIL